MALWLPSFASKNPPSTELKEWKGADVGMQQQSLVPLVSPLVPVVTPSVAVWFFKYVMDAAAMREYMRDGNFIGVRNLRKEFIQSIGQL